jgi:hypothetical protein
MNTQTHELIRSLSALAQAHLAVTQSDGDPSVRHKRRAEALLQIADQQADMLLSGQSPEPVDLSAYEPHTADESATPITGDLANKAW